MSNCTITGHDNIVIKLSFLTIISIQSALYLLRCALPTGADFLSKAFPTVLTLKQGHRLYTDEQYI